MGNEARSAVGFRTMIRATLGSATPGDPNSLRNINTAVLPDGATCFVIETASVYRLRKGLTVVAAPPEIIAPGAGGGFWVQASMDEIGGAEAVYQFLNSPFTFAATGDPNWVQPGASTTSAFLGPSGLAWTALTLAQMRYNGPQARYLITLQMALQSSGIAETFEAGISVNDDLTGGSVPAAAGTASFRLPASPLFANVTMQRVAIVAPTNIIQPRVKGPGGVVNALVVGMTMTAVAL